MKKVITAATGFLAFALLVNAQTGTSRPKQLSEAEFERTIDSFAEGDPATKSPLSFRDQSAPRPSARAGGQQSKPPVGATEITAREASFDQKSNQAVFAGDVYVRNPEFDINCDKLTAFLKSDKAKTNGTSKPGDSPVAKPAEPPLAKTGTAGPNTGGLDKAIAEGSVVITQEKTDADGKLSRNIGRSKRAVYEAGTGDVTLTGRPEVQQGINTIVALDESTIMILNREGRMKVTGPHKTVIKDSPDTPKNGR